MIKFNGRTIIPKYFPDGTLNLTKFGIDNIVHEDNNVIDFLYTKNEGIDMLLLNYITNYVRDTEPNAKIFLYIPYLPNARMDRVKNEWEIFTLKYFCNMINALNFDEVWVQDVHSNVASALLNRVNTISNYFFYFETLNEITENGEFKDKIVLYYPDEGAMKRYSEMAVLKHYPYAFGIKQRDWETGKIKGIKIETNGIDLKNKIIVMVDDICSKGGTYYHAVKALEQFKPADYYLITTHCEDSIVDGELYNEMVVNGKVKVYTDNYITHENGIVPQLIKVVRK